MCICSCVYYLNLFNIFIRVFVDYKKVNKGRSIGSYLAGAEAQIQARFLSANIGSMPEDILLVICTRHHYVQIKSTGQN